MSESVVCVVVGDAYDVLGRSAKTLLLIAFETKEYPQSEYIPTVCEPNISKNLIINGTNYKVDLHLKDTTGCEDLERVMGNYYLSANVFILLFSVVSPEMFHRARYYWGPRLKNNCPNIPIILVGTDVELRESPNTKIGGDYTYKMDPKHPPITYKEGVTLASALGAVCYLECSTFTQTGLDNVFDEAVRAAISPKLVIKPSKTNSIFSPLKILSIISKMGKSEEKEKEMRKKLITENDDAMFVNTEKERIEIEKAEKERIEIEKAEKERIEIEKSEKERIEIEKAEKERIEIEKEEKERIEIEKAEKERIEREKSEKDIEREKAEKDIEREKAEKERIEREKTENDIEREKTEKDIEREKTEKDIEREKAEKDIEREKAEKERFEREKAEKERIEREKEDNKSAQPKEKTQISQVISILQELRLLQYSDALYSLGAELASDLFLLEDADWEKIQVKLLHRKKILQCASSISTTALCPTQPLPSEPKDNFYVRQTLSNDEPLVYTGALEITTDFIPEKSCIEYLHTINNQPGFHKLSTIIQECEKWFSFFKTKPDFNPYNLTDNEMMAIALYTYDLGLKGQPEDNFYFLFNKMLQQRDAYKLRLWSGYLYYLQKALAKLPNVSCVVYRGINQISIISKEYTIGRRIHWSAFSSTTTNLETAKVFAAGVGVVMQINIFNGKCIRPYSVIPREDEILLSPNMTFIVTKSLHNGNDMVTIELLQEKPENTFVF